jgi:hypothetical protein
MWVIAAVFFYSYCKRVPLELWYAVPFGIICCAIAVRIIGQRVRAAKRRSWPAVGRIDAA